LLIEHSSDFLVSRIRAASAEYIQVLARSQNLAHLARQAHKRRNAPNLPFVLDRCFSSTNLHRGFHLVKNSSSRRLSSRLVSLEQITGSTNTLPSGKELG